jgi:UDP-GlcNAc:undecaprenyl-phosphate GlcNAc-1-phosphate transferase
MHDYLLYITALAVPFGVSLFVTPFSKKIARRLGAIDYPKARGMHNEPIPRMGGIAIVAGFMAAMLVLLPFVPEFRSEQFFGFIAGAVIIALLGIFDDIYNLDAKLKFAIQIIAALIAVYSGTRLTTAQLPFHDVLQNFEIPLTILWIVGLTNAVNLIDGLDGLAAGVSSISGLCLMSLCFVSGADNANAIVLSASIAGSCLGFLPRNFNPAEVIMGDTGSTFLGYVLAVSSMIGVFKYYAVLSLLLAVMVLALPILDTSFAMIRRALSGKPIMSPDRGHLHHRLIDAGFSPKQAVMILYTLSALSGIIAILIAMKDYRAIFIMLAFIAVFIVMVFIYRKRLYK